MNTNLRRFAALLPLAAAFFGLTACQQAPEEPRRQAVLLLLDAARPDRFSSYGYSRQTTPEMDSLAASGVVFHQHYAQGTGTRVSVPALLYSRYYSVPIFPNDPQVPYASPKTLFRKRDDEQISFVKAFQRSGFRTAAISAHLWTGADTPFAAEFMEMNDLTARFTSNKYPYPLARNVIDATIRWIEEHKDEDFFLYVHLMDTHYPHFFESDAQEFFGKPKYHARNFRDGGQPTVPTSALTPNDLKYIDALYDGSLRYTDREVGRLLAFLREEEMLADMTLAITADHGEHLVDGPNGVRPGIDLFAHGGDWLDPVAKVPFIVASPGLEPGEFHDFSEGVDVGPTLLALAGGKVPQGKSFDGVNLAEVIQGTVPPRTRALMAKGIRTDRYKLIFDNSDNVLLSDEAPAIERLQGQLYDLEADPQELKNVFKNSGETVAELLGEYRTALQAYFKRAESATTSEQPKETFAISSRFFQTATPVPALKSETPPAGWSRVRNFPHSVLIGNQTDDLEVSLRIPNGRYTFFVGLKGQATITVGDQGEGGEGQQKEHSVVDSDGMAQVGPVDVTGETFRATIRPPADGVVRIFFFGFVPPGASMGTEVDDERTRRLRALGYI